MSIIDTLFLLVVLCNFLVLILSAKHLNHHTYNKLCIAIFAEMLVLMTVFTIYDIMPEPSSALHIALLVLAQYAVYALSIKAWLGLNFRRLSPRNQLVLQVTCYSSLACIIVSAYWIKSAHPLILTLTYPISTLALSLLAEYIEEKIEKQNP